MKLSLVIPVYNERATLKQIVERVVALDLDKEVVLVDDRSTDGSRDMLTALRDDGLDRWLPDPSKQRAKNEIKVLLQDRNQGKGAALRAGFAAATGDIVLIQDADLEYDPEDYPKLLWPIVEEKADVVYGSRFIGEPHRVLYYWHTLGNKFLTTLSNMFTNLNLTDMEVCYKVFRKSVLDRIQLKCNRFGFEPEITQKIAKMRPRLRIYEVGVAYYGRSYEEGKKITWKDGIKAILTIIRFRISD